MANKKKGSILIIIAALAALAGLVVYLVTSYVGYLAEAAVDMRPIAFSVIALILLAVLFAGSGRLPQLLSDALLAAAAVLIIASFSFFALSRVPLAADVYFIPVNYPAAEETILHTSLAGLAAYCVSILALILEGFFGKEN